MDSLKRFIEAQQAEYQIALAEIKEGKKQSHWMWYIFPQISGLGTSKISRFYAIKDLEEAQEYFNHPILSNRLVRISNVLLQHEGNDAFKIFGSPDDLKLKSSMTLFAALKNTNPVFELVLKKFFNGTKDDQTLKIISPGS